MMSPALFILAIVVYLVSMVAGLIAAFFIKQIPARIIHLFIVFHVLFFLLWLLMRNDTDSIANPGNTNYLFLAYFCSGVFTAGIVLRSSYPVYLKVYYTAFLLSLAVFIVSPSRVLGFIVSGNLHSMNPARFHISENYYFVEQQSEPGAIMDSTDSKKYKVVREMGVFHKTLSRDILLPNGTDSLALLNGNFSDLLQVRIYYIQNSIPDSLDLNITIGSHRDTSKELRQIRH